MPQSQHLINHLMIALIHVTVAKMNIDLRFNHTLKCITADSTFVVCAGLSVTFWIYGLILYSHIPLNRFPQKELE